MSSWEIRQVPIKYQLSDWTILSVHLRLQCRSIGLLDESPQYSCPMSLIDELAEGSQGFMMRALPIAGELPNLVRSGGYFCYAPLQYSHFYVDLTLSFEDYVKSFSSKTRSTISRKVKKYAEHSGGCILWRTYKTSSEMRDFFRLAREVSKRTYQERRLDVGLPESEDFVRQAEFLAAENRMRAYILFDGERPVSYLYCPVIDSILIYAYLGYDPDYKKMSVGTVLQWLALEQLFDERCFRAFDFTEGQSDHKRLFSTNRRQCANLFLVKVSLKSRMVIYGHLIVSRFSKQAGELLEYFGAKAIFKRLLRR